MHSYIIVYNCFIFKHFVGCKVSFLSLPQEETALAGSSCPVQQVLYCDVIYKYFTANHNNSQNHQWVPGTYVHTVG